MAYHRMLNIVVCYTLGPCFLSIYKSLLLLTTTSHSISPLSPLPLATTSLFSMSMILFPISVIGSFVSYFILHIWVSFSSVFLYLTYLTYYSSVHMLSLTFCNPMDYSTPAGFPVYHQLPKLVQIHVHQVSDAIQPSHPLSSPSPPTFNLSQHQGLFWWVSSSHQVAKVLEFHLQHQSFQWIFKADFL